MHGTATVRGVIIATRPVPVDAFMDFQPAPEGMSPAVLLLVIFVGVAAGNLFADWAMQQWIDYRTQQLISETTTDWNRGIADLPAVNRERAGESRAGTPQTRSESQLGRLLQANCERWTRAEAQYGTGEARRQMARWCDDYRAYVDEGELPRPDSG